MSVQDLNSIPEATAEPDDVVVRRLVRAIDYAEGFWLGFAKSNTPAQRRRLAAVCRDLLAPLKIRVLEIDLTEPVTDLLPLLRERLAADHAAHPQEDGSPGDAPASNDKLAIFVRGLEHSIPSREAYPPLLSSLNLNRELFRQHVPHPLLLWLPDYALTALARQAPDLWAWRSGLYEFAPERESADQELAAVGVDEAYILDNLSERAKRERLVMLNGLFEDYRELGNGTHEQEAQARILNEIGALHWALGEWDKSKHAFEGSKAIYSRLNNEYAEASYLHNLAVLASHTGDYDEARRYFRESLEIKKRLGHEREFAASLHGLASIAHVQRDLEEARRLYGEGLELARKFADEITVANILRDLGVLANKQGQYSEAKQLHKDSLELSRKLNNENGIATNLNEMGRLAALEGDDIEAARLFREALSILEKTGSPYTERARRNLARIEDSAAVSDVSD